MTKYMNDIDIDIMAIVTDGWNPKNGKQAMIKAQAGHQIMIKAIDDIEGLLFGTVVDASVKDADGHKITNEQVQMSCHNYQKKLMEKGFKADLNHDQNILDGVDLVENYVDRSKTDWSHEIVLNFSDNKDLMEKAKNSSIKGISPAGRYRLMEKAEDESNVIIQFANKIIEHFKPKEIINKAENDMTKEEMIEFLKSDEGKALVKEINEPEKELEKAEETQKEPETKETSEEPDKFAEMQKAFDEKLEEMKKGYDAEIDMLKKERMTGDKELTPVKDIDDMTNDELAEFKKADPDGFKKALKEKAKQK